MDQKKRARKYIWIALVLTAAMLLNGCSLRPGPVKTPEGKALFRLGFSGTPDSLNPYAACDEEAEAVFALLYDTLFSVDSQTQECVNGLCRDYTVSDSASGVGKLWRIELRDDVFWSDGQKLTSSDVEFSLQSLKDLSVLYSYPYCELLDTTGIAIEDETHLAMIVWGEEAIVKACLARIPILPRHVWNELSCMRYDSTGIAENPLRAREEIYRVPVDRGMMVGSGLYTWGDYRDGICTLRLNEAYWNGESRAQVLELRFGLTDTAAALKNKEIDACWDLSLNDYRELSKIEDYRVTTGTDGTMIQLGFCFSGDRLAARDAAIRQAAEYCTSRDTLLLYAFGGGFSERGLLSPYSRFYSMDEVIFDRPFDITTASTLLSGAGWLDADGDAIREKNGVRLTLSLICSEDAPAWQDAAKILRACFAEAGMDLQIRALPTDRFIHAMAAGDYDLCLTARNTYPDPWMIFRCFYWDGGRNSSALADGQGGYSSPGWNDSGYAREEYDRVFERMLAASDPSDLRALTAKAGEYLYDDSAAVTIGFTVDYQACSRVWTGMKAYSGGGLFFTPLTLNEQFRTLFSGKMK